MSYSVTHNFGFGVTGWKLLLISFVCYTREWDDNPLEDNFVYGISSSAGHPAVCLSSVVSSFTLVGVLLGGEKCILGLPIALNRVPHYPKVNDAAGMQGTVDEVACAYNQCVFRTSTLALLQEWIASLKKFHDHINVLYSLEKG